MADNNKYIQAQKFRLSGSGISSSATSITLQTFNLLDGTAITSSNIGSVAFGTLESGTSKEEQISFTGITDNGNGTFTLTGVTRGLRFVAPYDEVSANKFSHAGGSVFVLSNTAGFYDRFAAKDNEETINQVWTFAAQPKSTAGNPTATTDLVTKAYADALVLGTLTTINVIVPGTAGETIADGNLVYFDETDNEWKLCDADTAATVNNVLLGIAQGAGTNGVAITNGVLLQGVDDAQSGLTEGDVEYASNTTGGISASAGTVEVTIGIAKSATELYFNPRFNQQLTENQQDLIVAIEGGTDWYGVSAVGTDSYAITIAPAITAYVTGMKFRFKADVANIGACTLAVSGLSALAIKKLNDQDLITGDIEVDQIVEVVYDGTDLQMQSQTASTPITVDIQTFTSSGTWTKPTGALRTFVQVWGAGGAGGGVSSATGYGGGGGGGAYSERWFTSSSLSATETTTVGTGGTGGTGNGPVGGNSTFGSYFTSYGGGGGSLGNGTTKGGGGGGGALSAGISSATSATGGAGGGPSGGAATVSKDGFGGGGGGSGGVGGTSGFGGGGGGSDTNVGNGSGGSSIYGGGGGGGADAGGATTGGSSIYGGNGGAGGTGNNNGSIGIAAGGGGGGGARNSSGTSSGGTGAVGRIIVTTFN